MITIPLSKQGKNAGKYEAIIDDIDADLAKLNWHCHLTGNMIYARNKSNGLLQRVILSRKLSRPLGEKEEVDHINRDGLDNRRDNLRLATHSQNMMNSNRYKNNELGFKGVQKRGKRYAVRLKINKKQKYLGVFDTPEQAHAAYCEAAKEHFGEFANEG